MHLLVIDDEASVLKSLEMAIRARRPAWQAEFIQDPTAFMEKVLERDYDVILSDIKMPGIDGITLLRDVKAIAPHTPVVLLTGYRASYDAAARDCGAFAVLDKPFDLRALVECLEAAARWRPDRPSNN